MGEILGKSAFLARGERLIELLFLDSSASKSRKAVLTTSLAELYRPEDTSLEINSSKYSPNKIEVFRAIMCFEVKVPRIGIFCKSLFRDRFGDVALPRTELIDLVIRAKYI